MAASRSKPDQFQLRLPPGLRDRIKAYADHQGRSMNEEIVRILEREFPEPWTADARIDELLEMISVLQRAGVADDRIARLVKELKETLIGIYSGRVQGLDEETRKRINGQYQEWQEREYEYQSDLDSEYDAEEVESLSRTGRTEKFVGPDGSIGPKPPTPFFHGLLPPEFEDDDPFSVPDDKDPPPEK